MKKLLITLAVVLAAGILTACDGVEVTVESSEVEVSDIATALSFPDNETLTRSECYAGM